MPENAKSSPPDDQGEGIQPTLRVEREFNVIPFPDPRLVGRGALQSAEGLNEAQASMLSLKLHETAMADMTREEFDAKRGMDAAKTDAKFAAMLGEIRVVSTDLKGELGKINVRLDNVEKSTSGVKATIIVTAVGVVAVVIGVLAYGSQWFGLGIATHDTIRATIKEMQEPPALPLPPKPRQ